VTAKLTIGLSLNLGILLGRSSVAWTPIVVTIVTDDRDVVYRSGPRSRARPAAGDVGRLWR
jgi:hypothetical protein